MSENEKKKPLTEALIMGAIGTGAGLGAGILVSFNHPIGWLALPIIGGIGLVGGFLFGLLNANKPS